MKPVLIRLLAVILVVVAVCWFIFTFVDIPGNFENLKKLYEIQNKSVSEEVISNSNEISNYYNFELTAFNENKLAYKEVLDSILNIFKVGNVKNFTWKNENKLKSSMNKTFESEKELKDYIVSVTNYAESVNPDTITVQNMINKTAEKISIVTQSYTKLKEEITSYLA